MYELENIGWKITQIRNPNYPSYTKGLDFTITHRVFAPLDIVLQNKTIKEVIEHIEVTYLSPIKFMGVTLEGQPRREYSFKFVHDQEQFAKLWGGVEINRVNNWGVLI